MPETILRPEDVTAILAEIPEGHRHLRTTVRLVDGSSRTFQEAAGAALVRACVAVKTDPRRCRVLLTGRPVAGRREGYAEWQLIEEPEGEAGSWSPHLHHGSVG